MLILIPTFSLEPQDIVGIWDKINDMGYRVIIADVIMGGKESPSIEDAANSIVIECESLEYVSSYMRLSEIVRCLYLNHVDTFTITEEDSPDITFLFGLYGRGEKDAD